MFVMLAARWILALLSASGSGSSHTSPLPVPPEPATAAGIFASLDLNQSFIEARRPERRASEPEHAHPGSLRLCPPREGDPTPKFDDPRSVVRFLLAVIESGTVYPTEGYFYFRFDLDGRSVSGNLRFTSIDEGVLHTGYFETSRDTIGAVRTGTFTPTSGLAVEKSAMDPSGTRYRVSLDGQTAEFMIPTAYRARPPSLELPEHERFVSGVLDESAYALVLIFDAREAGFRFLLNPAFEPPEALEPLRADATHLLIGRPSGFVFAHEPGRAPGEPERLTLVGIDAASVRRNDYFDGPFDQVPPDLDLRPLLHIAYPYTRDASPVDEHGNFIGRTASRVAIAPYTAYGNTNDLLAPQSPSTASMSIADTIRTLTREYQQDFVPPLRPSPIPDAIPVGPEPVTLRDILERHRE